MKKQMMVLVMMVLVWCLLFVLSDNAAKGVVETTKMCPVPPTEKEKMLLIKNPLAQKVFQKYQSINTYHAIWTMTYSDPNIENEPNSVIWEVAFDRPTNRVLFFFGSRSSDEKQPLKMGQLFIADGKMMHIALSSGGAASGIQQQSIAIADPNALTYRDMRQRMFLRPFDLPLLFSELHFMEVIESQIKEIRTLDESESLLRFEVFPDSGETSAAFWVEPETFLIQRFTLLHPSGQGPVFTIKSIEIDQPLDETLFDFEKKARCDAE